MKKIIEGYKKTLAGEIPEEWGYEELNKLVDKITDGTHKTPTYTESGIPFLRVTDIQKSEIDWNNVKYISQEEHLELIKRCNPEIGDILYSKNGTIGIPKIIDWDNEFSIFVSLCLIKMKKQESYISNKYLEQFLKSDSCMRQIRLRAKQGTVTNLHLEEIRELIIPIPTIKEQEKIASILSTVDEQIDNVDILIEKNKELKKGLMQTLLTKGIGHTKFKKTEIGEIPEEWEVVKFKEITDILRCGVASTPTYVENGIPFLSAQNVNNEKLSLHKYNFISEDYHKQLTKNDKPQKGDILYSRVGANYGIAAVVDIDFEFSVYVSLTLIRMKSEYDSRFYKYLLNSTIIRKQADIGVFQGGGVPNLNVKVVEKFNVVVPSKYEQTRIATILSEVDEKIEEYENKKQKLEELKKGLMQQLLSGNIRVS